MSRNEIETLLATSYNLFFDAHKTPGVVYLTFAATQESELFQCAESLPAYLNVEDSYIEINKAAQGLKYQVIIASPYKGTAFHLNTPVQQYDYNELLFAKSHEEKVTLVFYIAQKEVHPTPAEIAAIKNDPDYDDEGVIKPEEPHYIGVEIPIKETLLKIKSDDNYKDDSAFVDLKPEIAMTVAAQLREGSDEDNTKHN